MARIGSIPFAGLGMRHDSAAAFLLSRPPGTDSVVTCEGAEIEVRSNINYVVARFTGARDAESAYLSGFEFAQAGLDLLSILGKADLVTRKATEEYLVAWQIAGEQSIRIHSTTTLGFSVPPVQAIARDADGREITKPPSTPPHHMAFRYFRLSQASEDLHEAFRNLYLCFELLLSSRIPLTPRERDWLKRGLTTADAELELGRFFTLAPPDPVDDLISSIYTATRLPLFHAKAGRDVIEPHGSEEDRGKVLAAMELLTKVVLAMSETWYDARRLGGWVFPGRVYDNLRGMYSAAKIIGSVVGSPAAPAGLVDLDAGREVSLSEANARFGLG